MEECWLMQYDFAIYEIREYAHPQFEVFSTVLSR